MLLLVGTKLCSYWLEQSCAPVGWNKVKYGFVAERNTSPALHIPLCQESEVSATFWQRPENCSSPRQSPRTR